MSARERLLDVADLEPCEPLDRSLEAASRLAEREYLRILLPREPLPLFPLLEQLGCEWLCRRGARAPWEVLVWRRGDADAEAAARDR